MGAFAAPQLAVRPDSVVIAVEPEREVVVARGPDGVPTWRFKLAAGERVIVPPAVAGNSYTYLRTRSRLIALNEAGVLAWERPLGEPVDVALAELVALPSSGVMLLDGPRLLLRLFPDGAEQFRLAPAVGESFVAAPRPVPGGGTTLLTGIAVIELDPDGKLLWYRLRASVVEP